MRSSVGSLVRAGSALLMVLVAVLLVGCGGGGGSGTGGGGDAQPQAGGTLTVAQGLEAITLDPIEAVDYPSVHAISQINETLFKADVSGKVVPWLASRAEQSADGLTWTIQLRPGVKFSDGKPLTAADVVFSLEAVRGSANWGFMFESIKSITAKSPNTVVIALAKPVAALEAELSLFAAAIVPDNYGGESEKAFAQHPVGTGPFMFDSWQQGQAMNLDRNPHYWRPGKPLVDHLVLKAIPDDNSRISQLKGGQIDVMERPPWSQLESLKQAPELIVNESDPGLNSFMMMNLRQAPFDDARLREAVNLAVDREGIIAAAAGGAGEPSASWFPPALLYHDTSIVPPKQDLAKAKQLVAEAAKDGADTSATLSLTAGESYAAAAGQIVQQNLEEVGFKITLQPIDEAALLENEQGGKFDFAITYVGTDIPDPSELVTFYAATKGFYSGADTTEFSKLVTASDSELNSDKRRQLFYEMQEEIYEENNLIGLVYQPYVWATQDSVAGFENNALNNPVFANVGFDE